MRKSVTIFLLLTLISCTHSPKSANIGGKRSESEGALPRMTSSEEGSRVETWLKGDTVLFVFAPMVQMRWDNTAQDFIVDSSFVVLRKEFGRLKSYLLREITNSTETAAKVCGKAGNLAVGDVAFLGVSALHPFPFFEALAIQLDVYEMGCKYPVGMFKALDRDRELMRRKLSAYFEKH